MRKALLLLSVSYPHLLSPAATFKCPMPTQSAIYNLSEMVRDTRLRGQGEAVMIEC